MCIITVPQDNTVHILIYFILDLFVSASIAVLLCI